MILLSQFMMHFGHGNVVIGINDNMIISLNRLFGMSRSRDGLIWMNQRRRWVLLLFFF